MADTKALKERVNLLPKETGLSPTYSPIGDVLKGIDHQNSGATFQKNTDHQGLVLFTRPCLNLSYNNVLADRVLLPMLDSDQKGAEYSIYRAIRTLLDAIGSRAGTVSSKLIDDKNAFIPLLSNTVISVSGFPDITLNTYTSEEGLRREAWSMADDITDINNVFQLTANFANVVGDPITKLFHIWTRYIGNVYEGLMVPYPEMIVENEIDYQSRIWRLILDRSKQYVTEIGCANAAFPIADPLGAKMNYSRDTPYNDQNDQISIPFQCCGAEYNDPILYTEFNLTVSYFNPDMADDKRDGAMAKIPPKLKNTLNFSGYPRISETLELEWWVPKAEMEKYNR